LREIPEDDREDGFKKKDTGLKRRSTIVPASRGRLFEIENKEKPEKAIEGAEANQSNDLKDIKSQLQLLL